MIIRPIPFEPTRFVVESETRADLAFIVDSDWPDGITLSNTVVGGLVAPTQGIGGLVAPKRSAGGWACGCERFMADNEICKHIKGVRRKYPTGKHSLTTAVC